LPEPKYLLDVNVLVALTDEVHQHHRAVTRWFATPGLDWGLCALSEAGLLRMSSNPKIGQLTINAASAIVASLVRHPGYRYWPITTGWADLTAPFRERIFGHQQVTDAFLLGLAIKEDGVLVTFDKAIQSMAGPQFRNHVLVLQP
jgi:toxin-antitoxin system PIN domain toxin